MLLELYSLCKPHPHIFRLNVDHVLNMMMVLVVIDFQIIIHFDAYTILLIINITKVQLNAIVLLCEHLLEFGRAEKTVAENWQIGSFPAEEKLARRDPFH